MSSANRLPYESAEPFHARVARARVKTFAVRRTTTRLREGAAHLTKPIDAMLTLSASKVVVVGR